MPDREADRQRHEDANTEMQRDAAAYVRRIAREEALAVTERYWNDVGVDIATFEGRNKHARVLDWLRERFADRERINEASAYATKMKAREGEIDEALSFVRDLKAKGREIGSESRKGFINAVWAAIGALVAGAATAFVSFKSGGR